MGAEFDATIAFFFSLNVKRGEARERLRRLTEVRNDVSVDGVQFGLAVTASTKETERRLVCYPRPGEKDLGSIFPV